MVKIAIEESKKAGGSTYKFELDKHVVDKTFETLANASKVTAEKFVPNIGAGAAAGAAATGMAKTLPASMPLGQKVVATAATAGLTAFTTKVGIDVASHLSKNINLNETIKNSKHANTNVDNIPSPTDDKSGSGI
jgi:hypothetical protein